MKLKSKDPMVALIQGMLLLLALLCATLQFAYWRISSSDRIAKPPPVPIRIEANPEGRLGDGELCTTTSEDRFIVGVCHDLNELYKTDHQQPKKPQ